MGGVGWVESGSGVSVFFWFILCVDANLFFSLSFSLVCQAPSPPFLHSAQVHSNFLPRIDRTFPSITPSSAAQLRTDTRRYRAHTPPPFTTQDKRRLDTRLTPPPIPPSPTFFFSFSFSFFKTTPWGVFFVHHSNAFSFRLLVCWKRKKAWSVFTAAMHALAMPPSRTEHLLLFHSFSPPPLQ